MVTVFLRKLDECYGQNAFNICFKR